MSKNIVILCDGTGSNGATDPTNVWKLRRMLEKDEGQRVYYHPGIGGSRQPRQYDALHGLKEIFALATGNGFYEQIIDCYDFLVGAYAPGDNIFLFGFSRGAYAARVLGGFVSLYGILPPDAGNLSGEAFSRYVAIGAGDNLTLADGAHDRKEYGSREAPIRFIGAWDTVNSVVKPSFGIVQFEKLPFALRNANVRTVRHALAAGERRSFFAPTLFDLVTQPEPETADIKQVWFAGDHGDVGGGYPEAESGLSKVPLEWMLAEAIECGLRVNFGEVNNILYGMNGPGNYRYVAPDPVMSPHGYDTLSPLWHLTEFIPKASEDRRRLPHFNGQARRIAEHALVHVSIAQRGGPGYGTPNLPSGQWQWEQRRPVTQALAEHAAASL